MRTLPITLALALALAGYLLWPYWMLWQLDRAARGDSPAHLAQLARLVDLDAVRDQLRRRLNKYRRSQIGEVSDVFIRWIEQSLRQAGGEAIDTQVTLDWLMELLRARAAPNGALLPSVRQARLALPRGFLIRIEREGLPPLYLLMRPAPLAWRIIAVYY